MILAWGKIISIDGSLKDIVGVKNSYRYREYRYDTETRLYYLQSRYYNPEWGRFINADGILGEQGRLISYNMFTYCLNNPISMVDKDGKFAIFAALIAGPLIVKVVLFVAAVLTTVYAYYKVVKPLVSSISSNISNPISSMKVQSKSKTKSKKKKEKRAKRSNPGREPNGTEEIEETNNHKSTNDHKLPT
ncbi:RHS repeat-associated core domain-containing protein [Clostridium sp. JNZ J1-5]